MEKLSGKAYDVSVAVGEGHAQVEERCSSARGDRTQTRTQYRQELSSCQAASVCNEHPNESAMWFVGNGRNLIGLRTSSGTPKGVKWMGKTGNSVCQMPLSVPTTPRGFLAAQAGRRRSGGEEDIVASAKSLYSALPKW